MRWFDGSARVRYLAAEAAKDADVISRCFTKEGVVRDEGREYRGRDAIRQWKAAADAKYTALYPSRVPSYP